MGGKIDVYLDCVSPYSYYALLHLLRNREVLASHGVELEFHPVFLGGINVGSGNKPPWTLPAKAKYGKFDHERARDYFGCPDIQTPSFFPIVSLLPQRAMTYIKFSTSIPQEKYIASFRELWIALWEQQMDLSKPQCLVETLRRQFSAEEVEKIMEATKTQEIKQKLIDTTQQALDRGAFGCPWFWVRNEKNEEEPFFGSDRFHFMWRFLDLPWRDIEIVAKSKGKAKI
ncbi:uncharacterized protein K452DRAFT_270732 [Aplosporella prunicola CBS 121167]|uniref:Glutathione S-transferase kappa n=1 Tax=Aplosporella prunicola CBS 121167 TaxID=1176127 RepID=A0A6A6BFL3_9PEZI|nr:uncharacterized protein K452DRAFT_270732 [Aplosporella prunicola CBS 121167]KAF2142024.1 hypothetical protein K452DRAFT_270732 [Aplosporella prunicola CBS 121167]